MNRRNKGFTLIELLVVIAIIALLIGILLPALGKARASARQIKDSSQIRGVMQGLVIWAQSNSDDYPLPTKIDKANQTLATAATRYKDATRHIFSLLLFNGFCPPEMYVSPAESNGNIRTYEGYEYANPTGTVTPAQALWDPKYTALPGSAGVTGSGPGDTENRLTAWGTINGAFSYAHTFPFNKRAIRWSNTFNSTDAIVANRGPLWELSGSGATATWRLVAGTGGGINSNTLLIHGGRSTWEGNIGFNDNHTDYVTRPDPEGVTFTFTSTTLTPRTLPDNLFVEENDNDRTVMTDTNYSQANQYLRAVAQSGITTVGTGSGANPWRD